jgi:hypothetical protein
LISLLNRKIKAVKKENPENLPILATSSAEMKKILGKVVEIGGQEYSVHPLNYDNRVNGKPTKNDIPCWEIGIDYEETHLEIKPIFWHEKPKAESKKEPSRFSHIGKILDLPKSEAKEIVQSLDAGKTDIWRFNQDLYPKVFWRVLKLKADKTDDERDFDFFLLDHIFGKPYNRDPSDEQKKIYKIYTGEDFTGDLTLIKSLSLYRLFSLMAALQYHVRSIPASEEFAAGESSPFLDFAGIPREELKTIYQEEIKAIIETATKPEKKPSGEKKKKQSKVEEPVPGEESAQEEPAGEESGNEEIEPPIGDDEGETEDAEAESANAE